MKLLSKINSRLIIFAIFLIQCATAEIKSEGYDFRQAKWGMSDKEVRNNENIIEEGTDRSGNFYSVTEDNFAELPVRVSYYFSNNKLVGGGYIFTSSHIRENEYIDDYEQIKRYMTDIYGAPDDEIMLWQNTKAQAEFEDDPGHWGDAICLGKLSFITKWESRRTLIELFLKGANKQIKIAIRYISK